VKKFERSAPGREERGRGDERSYWRGYYDLEEFSDG